LYVYIYYYAHTMYTYIPCALLVCLCVFLVITCVYSVLNSLSQNGEWWRLLVLYLYLNHVVLKETNFWDPSKNCHFLLVLKKP
jgi:hypothetical protein